MLKVLQRKQINLDLLAESKVGKTMTRIIKGSYSDSELKETAQNLINIWKRIAEKEK